MNTPQESKAQFIDRMIKTCIITPAFMQTDVYMRDRWANPSKYYRSRNNLQDFLKNKSYSMYNLKSWITKTKKHTLLAVMILEHIDSLPDEERPDYDAYEVLEAVRHIIERLVDIIDDIESIQKEVTELAAEEYKVNGAIGLDNDTVEKYNTTTQNIYNIAYRLWDSII